MEDWQRKLTPFDAALCRMVESVTGHECEPTDAGESYIIEASYEEKNDPQIILAIWDAIEGRAGNRLVKIADCPERQCLQVEIKYYSERPQEAAFIPKIEEALYTNLPGF